jgi:ABC-type antimicrobial peptide transport system permease subunit
MTNGDVEVRVEKIERTAWAAAALMLLASLLWRSPQITAGIALGALLSILSFRWLRKFVSALLSSGRSRPPILLVLLNFSKYLIMGVALFVAIKYDLANAIALLVGVSVIFLAVCWEGMRAHRNT